MSFISLLMLSIAMSADAFAASVAQGSQLDKVRFSEALRIGLVFGLAEAACPVLGWALGHTARPFVESYSHWLTLAILSGIGVSLIVDALKPASPRRSRLPSGNSLPILVAISLAISLDAFSLGMSLAFVEVNIIVAAMTLGLPTVLISIIGTLIGKAIKRVVDQGAQILGGVILIFVGVLVFFDKF
ncbi:manganese efflux pump MntP family protein [Pseudomonas sp. NPDC089401]|uniref:manganese efflux pump MntP n=1 Tax=Pseudomonas sp. NPDC089401 TaxID=3364462 RepID=UPI0037F79B5B